MLQASSENGESHYCIYLNTRSTSLYLGHTYRYIICQVALFWSTFYPLFVMSCKGVPTHVPTDADVHIRTIHTRGGSWSRPRTHLSLWQGGLPFSGLVAWFLHGGWVSPRLCCLVTVRSRLWFMQIGRQGLVGQPRYVVRPSLGQCTKASQQKQPRCISRQHSILYTTETKCMKQHFLGLILDHKLCWKTHLG